MIKYLALMLLLATTVWTYNCQPGHTLHQPNKQVQLSERLSLVKMSGLNGKPFTLHRFGGRPVVLNYWATWCRPCISEMNSLEAVYQQYKDKIDFIAVSNEPLDKIREFKANHNFHFEFAHLDVDYIDVYVVKLPTTFLIDADGQLIMEEEGFRDWSSPDNLDKIKN